MTQARSIRHAWTSRRNYPQHSAGQLHARAQRQNASAHYFLCPPILVRPGLSTTKLSNNCVWAFAMRLTTAFGKVFRVPAHEDPCS